MIEPYQSSDSPRVSVILPVYDGAGSLQAAIDSIAGQTYADWEFLIADDGSTDHSLLILEQCAATDQRIRLFRSPQNRGLAATMNLLVAAARGEFIAVQEQDDRSRPGRLEAEVAYLDAHPRVGLVGGVAEWKDNTGATLAHFPGLLHRGEQYPDDHSRMVQFLLLEQCKVVNACCMFRRALLAGNPRPFDENARMSIDWQFFIDLAHRTVIAGISEVLAEMNRDPGRSSLTSRKELQFREARRCLRVVYDRYAGRADSPIDRALYRKALATELVLEGRYWGGFRGLGHLLRALVLQPTNRTALLSIRETLARGLRRALGFRPGSTAP